MNEPVDATDRDAWLDLWLASEPDGTLPRIIRQLRAELAAAAAPAYHVPGPYEIALAMGAGLAASGLYATPGAAMAAAWASIPEFWQGRNHYVAEIAPAFYGQATHTPGGEVAEADEFHA